MGPAIAGGIPDRPIHADWGFFEWAPHITQWSRDLFDGGDTPEAAFAVPAEGRLAVVSFDGSSLEDAAASRGACAQSHPDMMWLPVVGLDRHTPWIGLQVTNELTTASVQPDGPNRVQKALYRPISSFATAD